MIPSSASRSLLLAPLVASTLIRAADCNRNGIDDGFEVLSGTARDCNANLIPDACEPNPGSAFRYSAANLIDLERDGFPDVLASTSSAVSLARNRSGSLEAPEIFRPGATSGARATERVRGDLLGRAQLTSP